MNYLSITHVPSGYTKEALIISKPSQAIKFLELLFWELDEIELNAFNCKIVIG